MQNNKPNNPKGNPLASYARYSSMAIQMGLLIAAGAGGGYLLDNLLNLRLPVFTIILSLTAVGGAIWLLIKEISKTDNE